MADREKVMTWLEICGKNLDCSGTCPYSENGFGEYGQCRESLMADAYDLLKEQEHMTPEEFKDGLLKMFSSIWECEIDHLMFHDTIGELMDSVMQLYKKAVKWNG